MRTGKSSAVADIASQLGNEGRAVTHTPDAPGDFERDLFALDEELDQFAGQTIAPVKRGPGRPKGVVDRTTLQLSRFLRAKGYRDPAEFLASIVSMDTRELARELGEEGLAGVVELQVKAAKELMPYFHQKMPLAVEHKGTAARPLFIINDGEGMGAMIAGAIDRMSAFDAQYQEVSSGDDASSHDGRGDDDS